MQAEARVPWAVVVSFPARGPSPGAAKSYHGDGRDIILQGFHWDSHRGGHDPQAGARKSWYTILRENAPAVQAAGFTYVWFPPSSDSLAPQGYIPRRWNVLDTRYGSETELRAAIRALGPVKAMADIVLNHRVGVATPGADFADPPFPDNRAAIVRDDESGIGTGHHDTGERHPAGRDLDHTNADVRTAIKHYLRRLQSLGFKGWRYDLVKGYHGRFVGEYNDATSPDLSVGEFFDGDRQKVTDWIDATGRRSTAFDFPTRFLLFEACRTDCYDRLRSCNGNRTVPGGLLGFWPGRAVTFVDNHDTEHRRELDHTEHYGTHHFPGETVAMAYAYTLTHPGMPCVFWPHFFDWGAPTRHRLERLLKVRRDMGLHATSGVEIREACRGLYAAFIDGRVAVKLGRRAWSPGGGWRLAVDGDRFAVWTRD
ncbi:MAG: alpha-amylase [Gemmataceae bacterium]|nr:alpha-amylase [Gemmataceae bacterium]